MIFSSITFLYYFLPCVLLIYWIVPKKGKNIVLLFSSMFFYAWGEPKYVILMAVSILISYIFGILIEKTRENKMSKWFCICSVMVSLLILGYFKYVDFLIGNFNSITGANIHLQNIVLPIGISFYTFQIISYIVDVYRGEPAQKNPVELALYVSMFPQLIAGPIVRYSDIEKQLKEREQTISNMAYGIRRFIIGLGKKVMIANQLGEFCGYYRGSEQTSVLFCWMYAVSTSLQIYYDFSGYSDMAIGLGKMFGFHFMENFNYPMIASSITEFWRRWHISLGTWFKDYVYIPLGGNRGSGLSRFFSIAVVWTLTGLWHGASWNFVLWGVYFFVFLWMEKIFLKEFLKNKKWLAHTYVLFLIIISFVIFQGVERNQLKTDLLGLFGLGNLPLVSKETLYYVKEYSYLIMLSIIGATPILKQCIERIIRKPWGESVLIVLEPIFLIGLLVMVTAYLVDGSYNPFLYFRF